MREEADQTVGIGSKEIYGWWWLGDARMRIAAASLVLTSLLSLSACTPQTEPTAQADSGIATSISDPHGQAAIDRKIYDLESEAQRSQDHRTWAALAVLYGFEGRLGEARQAAAQAVALGADAKSLALRIDRAHNEGEI